MSRYVDHPLAVDARGGTAATDRAGWLHDLVEQVLFTAPGERVHRPDFGSGLLQLAFAAESAELAATTQFVAQGALEQWLGHLIAVDQVLAETDGELLRVTVTYQERTTGQTRQDTFTRALTG